MLPLTHDLMAEITSLRWLTPEQIKAQYSEMLSDAQNCKRVDILRSLVAYRLQEKFYKTSLSPRVLAVLDRAVSGKNLFAAPSDNLGRNAKKLTRNYKGVDYEVLLLADGSCEWDGKHYRSLTAVATAITGTHWNGPMFFGVKK